MMVLIILYSGQLASFILILYGNLCKLNILNIGLRLVEWMMNQGVGRVMAMLCAIANQDPDVTAPP